MGEKSVREQFESINDSIDTKQNTKQAIEEAEALAKFNAEKEIWIADMREARDKEVDELKSIEVQLRESAESAEGEKCGKSAGKVEKICKIF